MTEAEKLDALAGTEYAVDPYGYEGQFTCAASSAGAARYACFKAMREAGIFQGPNGFHEYLARGVTVTALRSRAKGSQL